MLENGWTIAKDFGHLAYGYVVISHASQGKTVDRVFVGANKRIVLPRFLGSNSFTVGIASERASRSSTPTISAALMQAVQRSDERLSATELVNMRNMIPLRHREVELTPSRQSRDRDGMTYDR